MMKKTYHVDDIPLLQWMMDVERKNRSDDEKYLTLHICFYLIDY